MQLTIASAERVFELLDEPEEVPDAADAKVIQFPRGDVAFDHVNFGYKPEVPLIEDMNIDVEPGQTIAIVGPTGAGKTTLVNLLMRFYDVNGGKITVDGVDIRDMRRGDLRSMFGMVLQDTWLFNGTIRDNIAYGRQDATRMRSWRRPTAAHADHFIRTLPDGYDTILNEEASNISQGQKQLLTIARAVLADPAILILDEATSSVDTRTEILIQRAMENLMDGPHQLRHRAPALDHPRRRPDPGDEQRQRDRAGHARGAAGRRAASTPTCTTASSPARISTIPRPCPSWWRLRPSPAQPDYRQGRA